MNRGKIVYLHTIYQLTPNNMKRFPTCMLLDYIGFGIATMAIMLVSKPFNIENALLRDGVLQQSMEDGLVTKRMMKGKLLVQLDAFDFLDNLSNVRRVINAQGKTETFYNIIPSYCLLHLTWRIK